MTRIPPYQGAVTAGDVQGPGDAKRPGAASDKAAQRATRAADANSPVQDQVTLSAAAQTLQVGSSGPARVDLAAIQAAIAKGSYTVSPAEISKGLRQDQLQMLPKTKASDA
ncbi:MAG: flagellar biosynthesis anti-sigma factor FlgM [Acidithiobacillus sp.]|uniref:flagellar biosynthesis anti-sigma factor FlgM n=1 Tax=Acidithiobacillus sp. TaxID=1872118 RepID=UPI003CFFC547